MRPARVLSALDVTDARLALCLLTASFCLSFHRYSNPRCRHKGAKRVSREVGDSCRYLSQVVLTSPSSLSPCRQLWGFVATRRNRQSRNSPWDKPPPRF